MKEIKTRKTYEKPTTTVVVMQHTQMLMVSGTEADRSGYGTANDGVVDPIGLVIDGNWMWE